MNYIIGMIRAIFNNMGVRIAAIGLLTAIVAAVATYCGVS